jgi:aryl carrier-like protein
VLPAGDGRQGNTSKYSRGHFLLPLASIFPPTRFREVEMSSDDAPTPSPDPTTDSTADPTAGPAAADELAALVRQFLRGPQEPGEDDNLLVLGLESIGLMTLASRLRAGGANVTFSDLIESPTLRNWRRLLAVGGAG